MKFRIRNLMDEQQKLKKRNAVQRNIIIDFRYMLFLAKDWNRVEKFMLSQRVSRIAIYGMGVLGQEFANLMKDTKIRVCYGIDKRKADWGFEVRQPDQIGDDMDVIIVTAEMDYCEIRMQLGEMVKVPVIRLRDLLEEIMVMPIAVE